MDIEDIRHDPVPAGPAAPVSPVRDDGRHPGDRSLTHGPLGGCDGNASSGEIQALAAGVPDGVSVGNRLLEVRRRIQARFYDDPDVAEKVARRIMESGDL